MKNIFSIAGFGLTALCVASASFATTTTQSLAAQEMQQDVMQKDSNQKNIVPKDVIKHYTVLAHTIFNDALITAQALDTAIAALAKEPTDATLLAARQAWQAARVPYQQSEVFRFGNPNVDDWEGQLNAWPLDEGLIDYVTSGYIHEMGNVGATANIIATTSLKVGHQTFDTSKLTPEFIASINELGGSEANVASGYHAIEFLLWGQDLNETAAGAGNRPFTDFVQGSKCTGGNCDRRVAYLQAASELLISDLQDMVQQWTPDSTDNYQAKFLALPEKEALTRILYGMGSLSLGELAGERMKVALEANSPEDEHDCFSDNTHFSHYFNALGVKNIYYGQYQEAGGRKLQGPSLAALVQAKNPKLHQQMSSALDKTHASLQTMVDLAESEQPMKFDQMIAPGNKKGEKVIRDSIHSLAAQTQVIEDIATALEIENLNPDTADHTF